MPDSNVEQKINEMEESLEDRSDRSIWQRFLEKYRSYNGFLNKSGGYYDKAEGHATGLGIAPIGLAYLLPTPMGELFILMQLGWIRTGTKKWARGEKLEGHLGDVTEEMAYTVVFAFLTVILLELNNIGSVTSIDISSLVLAMVGGA